MATFDAKSSVNITEFKKNPMAVLKRSKGKPVGILNRDVRVAYLIPAKTYEKMQDTLEDFELGEIVRKRQKQINKAIAVKLEEL
ncbi:type II toxin-antitoxin system prevent-host-death family antitoxin [Candidatus Berkiella cookevillensis]|uniref:Antitoxin n=1 Tax=Candidatus Berkiella cookevillensis TaxID=437022 RepID=A0A0Q9YD53_9GAMM|nr:type II toxin-antitoxin system prevent-host-death family antitoxin [Candidatus Berkiella cookevillensis]MCS5707943.1 type II toxin-antitoxin system prevent-host-death family antitoxin [Candidatus Berkiella cookevillensis]